MKFKLSYIPTIIFCVSILACALLSVDWLYVSIGYRNANNHGFWNEFLWRAPISLFFLIPLMAIICGIFNICKKRDLAKNIIYLVSGGIFFALFFLFRIIANFAQTLPYFPLIILINLPFLSIVSCWLFSLIKKIINKLRKTPTAEETQEKPKTSIKKTVKIVAFTISFLVAFAVAFVAVKIAFSEPVESKEQAYNIAQEYVQENCPQYKRYVSTEEHERYWKVHFSSTPGNSVDESGNKIIYFGGGLDIFVRKYDGKVVHEIRWK